MKDRSSIGQQYANFWFVVPFVAALVLLSMIIRDDSFAAVSRRMPAEASGTGYRPGSVPVIEQEFDLIAVRGDEPVDIVISPDGRRAYVPGRNTDTLFAIDLATDQIVEVIDLYPEAHHPLGPAPEQLAITPDGGRVLVTNANDDSLTVVDTATDTVVKTLPVGSMPVDVAISPDGSLAYVLNKGDQTITVLDPTATTVLTTVNVPGGGGPFAVTFAPDGSRAYVAIHDGPVYIVNPATHAVVGSITVPNAGWTGDLAISADGNTGYLNTLEGDAVIVLDLVHGQATGTFTVTNPIGLALNADGSRLYVGTFGFSGESAYNLWMFDTASSEVVTGVNFIHPAPYGRASSDIEGLALTPAGSTLYAASVDADGVFVVDAETLKPAGMIPTQAIASFLPLRAVISPDGAYLYVAGGTQRPTTVSVIDTRTLQVVGEIVAEQDGPCAGNSSGLALSPDGSTLYVLSSDGNCVLVADTQSRSVVGHFNVGTSGLTLTHIAVHPDGDKAYVLDYGGNVYVVDLQDHSVLGTIAQNTDRRTETDQA
jgi:YVTN family beta-propeller protein